MSALGTLHELLSQLLRNRTASDGSIVGHRFVHALKSHAPQTYYRVIVPLRILNPRLTGLPFDLCGSVLYCNNRMPQFIFFDAFHE